MTTENRKRNTMIVVGGGNITRCLFEFVFMGQLSQTRVSAKRIHGETQRPPGGYPYCDSRARDEALNKTNVNTIFLNMLCCARP